MSGDCMRFPDTVEEFMEQYKVVDKEGIYMSKGAKLVPIFRMEQWFEHEKAQLSQEGTTKGTTSDLISRRDAIDVIDKILPVEPMKNEYTQGITCGAALAMEYVKQLPSAQPDREKGTWTNDASCPFCGFQPWYERDIYTLSFCPNCGADMRGT